MTEVNNTQNIKRIQAVKDLRKRLPQDMIHYDCGFLLNNMERLVCLDAYVHSDAEMRKKLRGPYNWELVEVYKSCMQEYRYFFPLVGFCKAIGVDSKTYFSEKMLEIFTYIKKISKVKSLADINAFEHCYQGHLEPYSKAIGEILSCNDV